MPSTQPIIAWAGSIPRAGEGGTDARGWVAMAGIRRMGPTARPAISGEVLASTERTGIAAPLPDRPPMSVFLRQPGQDLRRIMAEREGFEPSERLRAQRFSRPPRSTTPAPLRTGSGVSQSLAHKSRLLSRIAAPCALTPGGRADYTPRSAALGLAQAGRFRVHNAGSFKEPAKKKGAGGRL